MRRSLLKQIVDSEGRRTIQDEWRTTDNDRSQKLTLSTTYSAELIKIKSLLSAHFFSSLLDTQWWVTNMSIVETALKSKMLKIFRLFPFSASRYHPDNIFLFICGSEAKRQETLM